MTSFGDQTNKKKPNTSFIYSYRNMKESLYETEIDINIISEKPKWYPPIFIGEVIHV